MVLLASRKVFVTVIVFPLASFKDIPLDAVAVLIASVNENLIIGFKLSPVYFKVPLLLLFTVKERDVSVTIILSFSPFLQPAKMIMDKNIGATIKLRMVLIMLMPKGSSNKCHSELLAVAYDFKELFFL